ncbi:nucleotide disphospho-sugar-binding domain-containing protein [Amycolatopsis silviterrae]|uniref:Nucleotide disphospho-sugar-binding domain-containing protein n=1 Tax=Amycolatopsis silviterrae TaxID=1656914 RepID=A0ABW5HME2_9PSEU
MSSVVLAAPGLPGELAPILELARHLTTHGHEAVVVTTGMFEKAVTATGARFVSVGGASDLTEDQLHALLAEGAALPPGPELLNFQWSRLFADPIADQHAALQQLLDEDPGRVLIANSVFLGAWPVALGAPGRRPARWIAVGANPLSVSSIDTTAFGPVPAGPGQDPHAGNIAANDGLAAATEPTRLHIETILRSLGADQDVPPFADGIVTVPDIFVSLSVPAFDFPRSDLPANVRYAGVLAPPPAAQWTPPEWWADLNDDRPVVAVTQGTVANRDLAELIEPTMLALAGHDVLVVAATGREDNALGITVPGNARVTSFVPFTELLPRCALLVTNGGFGATQQALAAGIPVVVAGDTEDKPMTAARVAFHRLGANLGTANPSPAQIRTAVDHVLADPQIAANVAATATAYQAHNALKEICDLIHLPGKV